MPHEGGSSGPERSKAKPKSSGGPLANVTVLLPVLGTRLGFSPLFHRGGMP